MQGGSKRALFAIRGVCLSGCVLDILELPKKGVGATIRLIRRLRGVVEAALAGNVAVLEMVGPAAYLAGASCTPYTPKITDIEFAPASRDC